MESVLQEAEQIHQEKVDKLQGYKHLRRRPGPNVVQADNAILASQAAAAAPGGQDGVVDEYVDWDVDDEDEDDDEGIVIEDNEPLYFVELSDDE